MPACLHAVGDSHALPAADQVIGVNAVRKFESMLGTGRAESLPGSRSA
jgi:hypothetical protein